MSSRNSTRLSDEDLKPQVEHRKTASLVYLAADITTTGIDYVNAAVDDHVALEEKGRPLIQIDPAASKRLCCQVRPKIYRAGN